MVPVIKIEKIYDAPVKEPVVNVAERSRENKRQRKSPGVAHCVPYQYIYQDNGNEGGYYQKNISGITTLVKDAKDTAQISHMHDRKERIDLDLAQDGQILHDKILGHSVECENNRN